MGIVVLNYTGFGRLLPEINKAIGRYPKKTSITKKSDGGGWEFLRAAKKKGLPTKEVRVVGVNRGYCVHDTVCDLIDSFAVGKIHVVEKATWADYDQAGQLIKLKNLSERCNKIKIV